MGGRAPWRRLLANLLAVCLAVPQADPPQDGSAAT
jgi:hypothetical protein